MAREMAVQMLYQVDLGGAEPAQAIAAFDLVEYLGQSADAAEAARAAAVARPAATASDAPGTGHDPDADRAADAADIGEASDTAVAGGGDRGVTAGAAAPRAPIAGRLDEARRAFAQAADMVTGTREHLDEIDARLRTRAENWRLERMPAVDRNILRLAVWEMLYEADVPPLVVVDEAVELAKHFGSEQSSRFVNGLLDGVLRSLEEVRRGE